MGLRLIYGRAGTGKSQVCLNEIKSESIKDEKTPLILIIPEQFSFQAGLNILKAVGEKGIQRTYALSFRRLAQMVFSEVGGIYRRYMTSTGKAMLLYSIIDELKGELSVFSRSSGQQGFVDTISEIITEFKRYNITPQLLKDYCKDEGNLLDKKLKDLILIYENFESRLQDNYIDDNDDLTVLSKKVVESSFLKGARIWIDEFVSFTPQEYSVIEELLKAAEGVNITLCMDGPSALKDFDETDIFGPASNTEKKLFKLCKDNNIKVRKYIYLDKSYKYKDSPMLSHLEKNYFSYPFKIYNTKDSNISIFKAVNRFSEVEKAARDIISLLRDKKLKYNEIAVVTRDINAYESIVKAVFPEYKIPFFIDRKMGIEDNPLIIFITSALEAIIKGFTYEPIFRFVKNPLSNIPFDDAALLENHVLASNIRGRAWSEDFTYYPYDEGIKGDLKEEYLKRINEIRLNVISPLFKLLESVKGKKTAEQISTAIYDYLIEIGIYQRIEELINEAKFEGDLVRAEGYGRIWNILMDIFDQTVEVFKDNHLTLDKYFKIFKIGLMQQEMGLIPPAVDQVLVGSIDRIRSHGVKAVFILGVNDGIFPMALQREGILSDNERDNLKEKGLELAENTRVKVFEEQFLIYRALTLPKKYLYLSYPIADHEGKTLRPSSIIPRVKKIFPLIKEESNILETGSDYETIGLVSMPESTLKEMVPAIGRYISKGNINPIWFDTLIWFFNKDGYSKKIDSLISGLYYRTHEKIQGESLKKLYGNHMKTSISRLERYAACPFSFFVEYGLKARERKIYKLNPVDLGSFIHEVLDKLSSLMDKEGRQWKDADDMWLEASIEKIVEETSGESYILKSSPRYGYISKKIERLIKRAIIIIREHIISGKFEPIEHEVVFGEGKYPPITIDLKDGRRVELNGKIDRIDAYKEGEELFFRIIDYKSGNKNFKLSDAYNGLELQLLTYIDAVAEFYEKKKIKVVPSGMFFFVLDDPIIKCSGDYDPSIINEKILKEFKMRGLVLNDERVIRLMDEKMSNESLIIPVKFNKDGAVSGTSSTISIEDLTNLRIYIKDKIMNLCERMLEGVIEAKPYKKKGKTPCTYCSFNSICKFDTSLGKNSYRVVKDIKDEDILNLIRGGDK